MEIDAIVAQQPDIVFLQEVDDPVGHMNAMITALEGHPHTGWDVPRYISKYQQYQDRSELDRDSVAVSHVQHQDCLARLRRGSHLWCEHSRARAIGATIEVEGKPLAIFSTRNSWASGDCPAEEQNRRLKAWANTDNPTSPISTAVTSI